METLKYLPLKIEAEARPGSNDSGNILLTPLVIGPWLAL